MKPHSLKTWVLMVAGCLALALGTVGVFIPVLPTIPFLLVAGFCFLRSSEKMYHFLMNHPLWGEQLRDYVQHKAVKRRVKYMTLIGLWVSLGIAALMVHNLHVRILLPFVGIGVTIHLLLLKTLPDNTREQ